LTYLCTQKQAARSGHKNSRQAKVAFFKKRASHFAKVKGCKDKAFFPNSMQAVEKFKKN
jgi:hypothetical protein